MQIFAGESNTFCYNAITITRWYQPIFRPSVFETELFIISSGGHFWWSVNVWNCYPISHTHTHTYTESDNNKNVYHSNVKVTTYQMLTKRVVILFGNAVYRPDRITIFPINIYEYKSPNAETICMENESEYTTTWKCVHAVWLQLTIKVYGNVCMHHISWIIMATNNTHFQYKLIGMSFWPIFRWQSISFFYDAKQFTQIETVPIYIDGEKKPPNDSEPMPI